MKIFVRIGSVFAVCMALAGCRGNSVNEAYLICAGSEAAETETAVCAEETDLREAAGPLADIVVYICGEVRQPGVYVIPGGSRICDALEAAGGMTEEASPDYWNLARTLTDGEMICFPTREEAKERREAAAEAGQSPGGQTASGTGVGGRININTATLAELMSLPGIGETRGRAILSYRGEHGAFAGEEDILRVSGIGNAVFEGMRDYITVD